jgi:hypothetical protein
MPKITQPSSVPSCGCNRCNCNRGPRCRCHDYNALMALAFWDFARMLRRRRAR